MIERGTSPKSLMEELKGGQELHSRLTVCMSAFSCSVLFSVPLYGIGASPFIDQGGGFYKDEGFI